MTTDLFQGQTTAAALFADRYPVQPHTAGGHVIDIHDGKLHYAPTFFSRKIADRALQLMLANDQQLGTGTNWHDIDINSVHFASINWRQDTIHMINRTVALPRLTAWYGDDDRAYTFSGLTLNPNPWNPMLTWFRDQLQQLTGIRFNSVLLNWYRSGDDHISWHADDERELGRNPVIASINLGATRRFLLRRKDDKQHKIELPLGHGSLLVMSGAVQHHWQHSVPKQAKVRADRINMTFRHIVGPD